MHFALSEPKFQKRVIFLANRRCGAGFITGVRTNPINMRRWRGTICIEEAQRANAERNRGTKREREREDKGRRVRRVGERASDCHERWSRKLEANTAIGMSAFFERHPLAIIPRTGASLKSRLPTILEKAPPLSRTRAGKKKIPASLSFIRKGIELLSCPDAHLPSFVPAPAFRYFFSRARLCKLRPELGLAKVSQIRRYLIKYSTFKHLCIANNFTNDSFDITICYNWLFSNNRKLDKYCQWINMSRVYARRWIHS